MNPWGALPAELDATARDRVDRYFGLLVEAGTRHNFTADPPERWVARHLADAFAVPAVEGTAVDVGAGAGFVGLALAICRPMLAVRLVDSQRKRTDFLAAVVAELGLTNVSVDRRRAEACGRDPSLRDAHDHAFARALAPPAVCAELVLPLVKVGGSAWLWLGSDGAAALVRDVPLDLLGGRLVGVEEYRLPDDPRVRMLARVEKVRPTPERFPRRDGVPASDPLTLS